MGGLFGGKSSSPAPAPTPVVEKVVEQASRTQEEAGAKMRGARRRGRQLLADTRLNPEANVQTLGSNQSL
jgi:hypothetical protein